MTTIICATHRPKNLTLRVVKSYEKLLREMGEEVQLLGMEEFAVDFLHTDSFGNRTAAFEEIVHRKIVPADRFVVIAPEYNGSYPGIFKAFLDSVKPAVWYGKKVALVGVATGRAGNLRGMDHLTDVFHYLRAEVFSLKIPISRLDTLLNQEGILTHEDTLEVLRNQAAGFLEF